MREVVAVSGEGGQGRTKAEVRLHEKGRRATKLSPQS